MFCEQARELPNFGQVVNSKLGRFVLDGFQEWTNLELKTGPHWLNLQSNARPFQSGGKKRLQL